MKLSGVLAFFGAVTLYFNVVTCDDSHLQIKNIERHQSLSNLYFVSWSVDFVEDKITFNVAAKTKGWIGFGLSHNGNMKGGDMIIGGVNDDGSAYFSDRHAVNLELPILDEKQDWQLISAGENETHTKLSFYRPLSTCDDDDIEITHDTLNMIWAIGATDELRIHREKGGSQVNFLDPPHPPAENKDFWSFRVPSSVPEDKDTSYHCTVHRAPQFKKKAHIIGFDVILDGERAADFTHHMILRKCVAPRGGPDNLRDILEPWVGHEGGDCYTRQLLHLKGLCTANIFVWGKGGHRMMFPDHVGFPISERPQDEFYVLEVHYDNPKIERGVKYETGINVFYTKELRPHDAGFLYVAHEVDSSLAIPPNVKDWRNVGHCSSECTQSKFPENGVQFFNVLLHAHLASRKLKLRHFRNGEELPWIAHDNNYDFNFQQSRPLPKEVTILKGDHLTLECTYDTTWKNPKQAVTGGLSSLQEMCDSFIFYYPRIPDLDVCSSSHSQFKRLLHKVGIYNVSMLDQYHPVVLHPQPSRGMTFAQVMSNRVNWTNDLLADFQNELQFADQKSFCDNYGPTPLAGQYDDDLQWPLTNYPKVSREFQPPISKCSKRDQGTRFWSWNPVNLEDWHSTMILMGTLAAILISVLGLVAIFVCKRVQRSRRGGTTILRNHKEDESEGAESEPFKL